MESLVCETCGSNNLIKVGSEYVCTSCGTKKVSERQLNKSEDIENYLDLFWRYRQERDYGKALSYLDKVLEIDSHNPVANIKHFSTAWFCTYLNRYMDEIPNDIKKFERICTNITIPITFPAELEKSERNRLAIMFVDDALGLYHGFVKNLVKYIKIYSTNLSPIIDAIMSLDRISECLYNQNIINDKINIPIRDACMDLIKKAIDIYSGIMLSFKDSNPHIDYFNQLVDRVKSEYPSYTPPPFRSFEESYP